MRVWFGLRMSSACGRPGVSGPSAVPRDDAGRMVRLSRMRWPMPSHPYVASGAPTRARSAPPDDTCRRGAPSTRIARADEPEESSGLPRAAE